MKKHIIIILIASMLLLCACQPTPETEVVIQKDFDRMIEQAKATPVPEIGTDTVQAITSPENRNPDAVPSDGPTETEAPKGEHIRESFTGKNEAFTVEIDADVIKPDLPMPIVRVYPGDIDDATVQRFFDVLTEGQKLYTEDGLNCKPVLERRIAKVMEEIASMESIKDDPLFSQESLDDSQHYLRQLQRQYKKAPDEPGAPVETVHLTYNEPTKYTDFVSGYFQCTGIDENIHFFADTNWKGVKGDAFSVRGARIVFDNISMLVFDKMTIHDTYCADVTGQTTKTADNPMLLTPREAEMKAAAIAAALGLSDMAPTETLLIYENTTGEPNSTVRSHPENYVYSISFSRLVNGVPVARPTGESSTGDEANPRPTWVYESLYMKIGDSGIVFFSYDAPLVLENTLVENATLKPFSKIMDIFRKMVPVVYEYELNREGVNRVECRVERITLSLQRVAEQDNIESGLLIPVWNFWGDVTCLYTDSDRSPWELTRGSPMLSIDAVTGSIIDPKKGY
ncbi:MAG: hypothetical protein IKZ44_00370 [Clostridia bacterium]|nr:hypothetical protein [Clostridia bacterium]